MKGTVRGGKFITTQPYEDLIEDGLPGTWIVLTQVVINNVGANEIHVVINGGDEIPVGIGENLALGDIEVSSLKVKEENSIIRLIGLS